MNDRDLRTRLRAGARPEPPADLLARITAEIPEDLAVGGDGLRLAARRERPRVLGIRQVTLLAASLLVVVGTGFIAFRVLQPERSLLDEMAYDQVPESYVVTVPPKVSVVARREPTKEKVAARPVEAARQSAVVRTSAARTDLQTGADVVTATNEVRADRAAAAGTGDAPVRSGEVEGAAGSLAAQRASLATGGRQEKGQTVAVAVLPETAAPVPVPTRAAAHAVAPAEGVAAAPLDEAPRAGQAKVGQAARQVMRDSVDAVAGRSPGDVPVLVVTVVGPDWRPAADVVVTVTAADRSEHSTRTDTSGVASFRTLPAGAWRVAARGSAAKPVVVTPGSGGPVAIRIVLGQAGR